ncbi:hypothetical protein EON67_00435 [archaeon]|nr:MAG: hypothetical protein EON67_00435 [archaeon]
MCVCAGLGFHLMTCGDVAPPNIQKWNVKQLAVDRQKRYLDAAVVSQFWAMVERDLAVRKPYLLPKPSATPGAATSGGGAAGRA